MDPNECLRRVIAAVNDQDREEYDDALEDLYSWAWKNKGFMPTITIAEENNEL